MKHQTQSNSFTCIKYNRTYYYLVITAFSSITQQKHYNLNILFSSF